MFDILETLFKLLHKADEEIKTEILQGLYHLSRPVFEFGEVFQKITMQSENFLKILDESTNYY